MLSSRDLVTKWNMPICLLFAILLSPIGLILWTFTAFPVLFINKKKFFKMNHWVILTYGFYIGLYISIIVFGPIYALFYKVNLKRNETQYQKSEKGKLHKSIVNDLEKLLNEVGEQYIKENGHTYQVSVHNDVTDKTYRLHLLFNKNGNIIITLNKDTGYVFFIHKYISIKNLNYEELKTLIIAESKRYM